MPASLPLPLRMADHCTCGSLWSAAKGCSFLERMKTEADNLFNLCIKEPQQVLEETEGRKQMLIFLSCLWKLPYDEQCYTKAAEARQERRFRAILSEHHPPTSTHLVPHLNPVLQPPTFQCSPLHSSPGPRPITSHQ
ncbi:hypothetical protein O3P69_020123 [Scylla paramamosain]|uniref:Uncharacterized protein n=1 Tax=Scylla paramamosain TaxID=85552 RepID=A0AAW0TK18_SCYPA